MEASRSDLRALNEMIWRMTSAARRGFAQVVDPARFDVLSMVAASGEVRPTEIATAAGLGSSSVTRHVQALADLGYLGTVANPEDGRSFLVTATAAGRAELDRFAETGVDASAAVLADWPGDDVRQLTALLGRLVDDWERHGAAARRPARWTRRSRPATPTTDTEGRA